MKVGLTEMYHNYAFSIKEEKVALLIDKKNYESTKQYLLDKISVYENYINTFTNIRYNDIATLNRCIAEKSVKKLMDVSEINVDIRRTINVIVSINKELEKINERIEEINKNEIDSKIHKNIICDFNISVSDAILLKGYTFNLGGKLGIIKIKKVLCDKRKKRNIDWNESNKKRKELESKGILPYKVLERDENRKILKDNGGEPWFVYFTAPFDYLWHWSKNKNRVFNSIYFKFKPTIYNNKDNKLGNINRLAELKRTDSPLLKNFL